MTLASPADRVRSLLAFPWELYEYQRFVESAARTSPTRNDMFADDAPRFEPRADDVLVASDFAVAATASGVRLRSTEGGADIEIDGMTPADVARIQSLIDGTRTAAEVGWQVAGLERFLRKTFGLVVFAPAAVEGLERALSGTEITRFPTSPYGIARPYWQNMVDVRQCIEHELERALTDDERAVAFLGQLHVIATMGASLDSFYKPSSPVSDAGVAPGTLWNVRARTIKTAAGTLFVSGPRAKVSALAGDLYHRLVYAQVGDSEASDPERTFADDDGLDWGRVLVARAAHDERFADWYCLPRPLEVRHFERLFAELREALTAAERGDRPAAVERAGRFHWRYVHLHPFRCANQCLAMNLVNWVLARALRSGIPHLVLDQFALRLRMAPYARLFARAVASYVTGDPNPAVRYAVLREKRRLSFSAMQRVGHVNGGVEAYDALRGHPEEAEAALLELT
ncbi:MAG: Fic family protein [Polyangiaceae bacterium]|nr:Fic family protein [Polyangiaceae bacterium]